MNNQEDPLAQGGSQVSTLGDLECFPHPEFSVDERVLSRLVSECHDLIEPEPKRKPLAAAWNWYLSWAIPGMGMFSEAYILFAIGNIEPLLSIVYPNCWGEEQPADCDQDVVKNVSTIEICGIVRHELDRRADPCPRLSHSRYALRSFARWRECLSLASSQTGWVERRARACARRSCSSGRFS